LDSNLVELVSQTLQVVVKGRKKGPLVWIGVEVDGLFDHFLIFLQLFDVFLGLVALRIRTRTTHLERNNVDLFYELLTAGLQRFDGSQMVNKYWQLKHISRDLQQPLPAHLLIGLIYPHDIFQRCDSSMEFLGYPVQIRQRVKHIILAISFSFHPQCVTPT
jgi:hypothetical protein